MTAWRQPQGMGRGLHGGRVRRLLFHDLRRSAIGNMERARILRSVGMKASGHQTESVYRRNDIVAEGDLEEAKKMMEAFG